MNQNDKPRRKATASTGTAEAQPSQRRRRLVKGALSAPVFLTLQNGSVFANTSNDVSYATKAQDAEIFDGKDGKSILCVTPSSPSEVSQDTSNHQVDLGNHYRCDVMLVEDKTQGQEPGNTNRLVSQFDQCHKYGNGGYIVAGSSHASICH